jgi:transposase
MVQGKAVPEDVQRIVVRLSGTMSTEDISMYTAVGERTVKKILAHFRETGGVISRKSTKGPSLHRSLTDHDINVCHFQSHCTSSAQRLLVHVRGYRQNSRCIS